MKKILVAIVCFVFVSCAKPTAEFSWTPTVPKAGEKVSFINNSTKAKKYDWNLGNMKVSSAANPENTYDVAGSYIIDLTANNGTRSDLNTQTITIVP